MQAEAAGRWPRTRGWGSRPGWAGTWRRRPPTRRLAQKLHASGRRGARRGALDHAPRARPTWAAASRPSSTSPSGPAARRARTRPRSRQSMLPAQLEEHRGGRRDHRQVRPGLPHHRDDLRLVAPWVSSRDMRDLNGCSAPPRRHAVGARRVQGHRRAGRRPRRARGAQDRHPAKARGEGLRRAGAGRPLRDAHPARGAPARRPALHVDYVFPTTRMKAAITVGMEIPVKVHPRGPEPDRRAVGGPAGLDRGRGRRHGRGDAAACRPPTARRPTRRSAHAQAQQTAEDPAEKIKKLGQMQRRRPDHPEEFDAKKAEILADF